MDKQRFIKLLNSRLEALDIYRRKAYDIKLYALVAVGIQLDDIRSAVRDCPEVFAELNDDQIQILYLTFEGADLLDEMADSYEVTLACQNKTAILASQVSDLIDAKY